MKYEIGYDFHILVEVLIISTFNYNVYSKYIDIFK